MPKLTLDTLEGHDPDASKLSGPERWFLCPLPACRGRQGDTDRVLRANITNGLWCCHRCQAAGVLTERRDTWRAPSRRPAVPAQTPAPTAPPPEPPEWTQADQGDYEAVQAEIAGALGDADLIDWLYRHWGCTLTLDGRGKLRAQDAGQVPVPVRGVISQRQEGLVAALKSAQGKVELSLD